MSGKRGLHPAVEETILSPLVRPFLVLDADYPDGPVRATTLDRNVVIDGEMYWNTNVLGSVSGLTEGAEQQSYATTVALSGVPGNFMRYLASQKVQGRLAKIRLGFINKDFEVIGELVTIFVGRMDTQDVSAGKTTGVAVTVQSLLVDWERARVRRFTDADQQVRYPGDRGLEYVAAVADMTILWGRSG